MLLPRSAPFGVWRFASLTTHLHSRLMYQSECIVTPIESIARLLIIYSLVYKVRCSVLEEEFEPFKAKQGTDVCYS